MGYKRACVGLRTGKSTLAWFLVIEGSPGGTIQVLELSGAQGPDKGDKAGTSQGERGRNEPGEGGHVRSSSFAVRSRTALRVTAMEEPDMAMAAIKGVTKPAIASGTQTAL